VVINIWFTLVV